MGEQAAKENKNTRETKVRDFGQENAGKDSKTSGKKPQRTRDNARKRNNANSANKQRSGSRKSGGPRSASDNKKAGERKGNNRERNANRGKGKAASNRAKQGGNKREQRPRNNAGKNRNQTTKPRQPQFEDNKTEQNTAPVITASKRPAEMEPASTRQVTENSARAPELSNQPDLSKEISAAEKKSTITAETSKPSQAKRKSKSWLEMTASELRQENEHLEEEIEELIESFKALRL
jgi:hypothetical protein